ncbi:MAG: BadF/BadG/BcrA/BcrD ATPase family protein [Planctomycetota bacterium]
MDELRVFGVDGGGTRLRGLILSSTRGILGRSESGSGNLQDIGIDGVRRNLLAARRGAFVDAGLEPSPLDGAWLALAGLRSDDEKRRLSKALSQDVFASSPGGLNFSPDVEAAWAGGLLMQPGLVLVAGTGSCAWGRAQDESSAQVGGHGPFIDDAGSGYDLGRRALARALRTYEGRLAPWPGEAALCSHFDLKTPLDLRDKNLGRADVASAARVVTDLAQAKDEVAISLLRAGAKELARMARALAEKLKMPHPDIVLAGGLMLNSPAYRQLVEHELSALLPACRLQQPTFDATLGAALLAMSHQCSLSKSLVEKLRAQA